MTRAAALETRGSRRFRLTRTLAVLMIVAGTLALADAVVTLLWQEPISALIASSRQAALRGDLKALERSGPSPLEEHALQTLSDERRRIAFLAGQLERHAGDGAPVGRIVIPRAGVDFVVVKGTTTQDLQSGPGTYANTRFPGLGGTTSIAGHRTTYLAPFRHIDALRAGDRIYLDMPYGRFAYTVTGQRVVAPTDVRAAVAEVGYSRLVLSACTPLFTAEKRLLVYARLTRTVPVGAARLLVGGAIARPIEARRPPPRRLLQPMLESLDPDVLSGLV